MTSRPVIGEAEVKVVATLDEGVLIGAIAEAKNTVRDLSDGIAQQLAEAGEIGGAGFTEGMRTQLAQFSLDLNNFGNQFKGLASELQEELGIALPPLSAEDEAQIIELSALWNEATDSVEGFNEKMRTLSSGPFARIKELSAESERLGGSLSALEGISDQGLAAIGRTSEEANQIQRKLNQQIEKTNTLLDETANTIVNRVTLAFIALSAASLFAFSQIEQEFTNLFIRLPEIADDARGDIVNSIRDLADEAEVGVSDAIQAAILATRLGVSIEDFADLSAQVEDLGKVTGDYVGSIQAAVFAQKQFGDTAGDLEDIAGKLFAAFRDGGVTMGEISRVMGQLAPLTTSVGVSFDEMIAILTAGGQNMLTASQTMTAMFTIIARLQSPTDELAEAFNFLGVESLPEAIKQFGGLVPFLVALQKASGDLEIDFTKMIGGFRTSRVILPLIAQEGAGVTAVLEDMAGATEELTRAGEDIEGTFAFQFARFREELGETLQLLGEGFGPILTIGVKALEGINEALNTMRPLLRVVGALMATFTAALIINRFIFAVSSMNLLGRAIGRLIPQLTGASFSIKKFNIDVINSRVAMAQGERGAISYGSAIGTMGIAIAVVAAAQYWSALQQRMGRIQTQADLIIERIRELREIGEEDPERIALEGIFGEEFIDAADFARLKELGFTVRDVAEAATEGSDAFQQLFLDIKSAIGEDLNLAEEIFLGFGFASLIGTADADLINKIREMQEQVEIAMQQLADETELEVDRTTAAIEDGVVSIDRSITEVDRIFGTRVPDDFYRSIRQVALDTQDVLTIYDDIEITAQQKIGSLLNTLITKPIEQVDLNKEEMAAALASNARVIEIWLDTIQGLEDEGLLRLAGNLAQLGPEFTAAFQDLASDPRLAEASDGILNQVAGGFPIEKLVATFGDNWADAMTSSELKKILELGGETAVRQWVQSAVSWAGSEEAQAELEKVLLALGSGLTENTLTTEELLKGGSFFVGAATDVMLEAANAATEEGEEGGSAAGTNFSQAIVQSIGAAGALLFSAGLGASQRVVEGANIGFAIRSPSGLGRGIGEDFVSGIWLGIIDEAAKGAGRIGRNLAKAVADGITIGLREKVQDLGGAFRTIFNQDRIKRSIIDAIDSINKLIERADVTIPLEIEAAEFDLAEALITGGQGIVTANEALGIEKLEQRVKDLALANKQGFASDVELAAAEDDLNKARDESIEKTDEVISLEEELISLNEELISTNDEIARAIQDLNELYINAALAMFDVVDALNTIEMAGPEVLDSFRVMAEAAGIPAAAFDAMVATVQASMAQYKATIESVGVKINFDPGRNATGGGGAGGAGPIRPLQPPNITVKGKINWDVLKWSVDLTENVGKGQISITPVPFDIGGFLPAGQIGVVGERGPELIKGPATVLGTQNTESLFRNDALGIGAGGNITQVTVPVEIGFPVTQTDARIVAETIRDAILDFEREDA